MLQAIAHLPLIALELLRHLRHRQGADSCAVILDTLVLTRSTALLHRDAVSVHQHLSYKLIILHIH